MPYPTITRTAYPDAAEVIARMKAMNFWPADSDTTAVALAERQAVIAAEAVAEEWEHGVDWNPFLVGYGDDSETERKYDSADQTGYLDLQAAAQSVESVSLDGTALTAGTDYWLRHFGEPLRGRPVTGLQFRRGLNVLYPRAPELIVVESEAWGYCATIPADVYAEIANAAALMILLNVNNPRDLASMSHDSYATAFDLVGAIDQKFLVSNTGKNYLKSIAKHRRPY